MKKQSNSFFAKGRKPLFVCLLAFVALMSPVVTAEVPAGFYEQEVDYRRLPWGLPARLLWQRSALDSYAYTLEQSCYCAAPPRARVYVADGEVIAVHDLDRATWLPAEQLRLFSSIDRLFELIDALIAEQPDSLLVVLDKRLGYPAKVEINPRYRLADDEINFKISAFKKLVKE